MNVSSWILALAFFVPTISHAEESCECPKLGCDPCSVERGVTFFTEKCGPGGLKMKSCARPTCIALEETTVQCPVLPESSSAPRDPIVLDSKGGVKTESLAAAETKASIGKVRVIQGSVSILAKDGKSRVINQSGDLEEGEQVEAGDGGGAIVDFNGGNKLHIHPNTTVSVDEFKDEKIPDSRKVLLKLIKGKIRNQVEQKYNSKTSYYKVVTKGAVAGVRGTVFVVNQDADGSTTRVETIRGKVNLADIEGKSDHMVERGHGAEVSAGKLSEVYEIPRDKFKELERDSRVDVAMATAGNSGPSDEPICRQPKGKLNQCLWRCLGQSDSVDKKCHVEQASVRCVRSRCNANGKWAEETNIESKGDSVCPGQGFIVKDCDY